MSQRPPITHQVLINWAGERVFRDAQTLAERNLVQDVTYEPPLITGTILWSNRPLKTAVRILPGGSAENQCPCRDSKERGIICAHVVALCLELIRRTHNPELEIMKREEMRRAGAHSYDPPLECGESTAEGSAPRQRLPAEAAAPTVVAVEYSCFSGTRSPYRCASICALPARRLWNNPLAAGRARRVSRLPGAGVRSPED